MSMIGNFLAVTQAELDALYADPEAVGTVLYEEKMSEVVDIDKAWHGIHFMLTGEQYGGDGPLAQVIMGGEPIGEEDVGYGPARGLSALEVKAIAAALSAVSEQQFRERFDQAALSEADIYPQIWDEGDEALDYIAHNFSETRRFYEAAAANGMAAVLFVS
ncbi:MAG: YfbM family protein [Burkholderiaceae bacterium]|nr:YfbM family protein [Burkholderiaceae bacterium]